MRVLVPLLGVLALVVLALWLRPVRERAPRTPVEASREVPVERAPELTPALAPALREEPLVGPQDARRESVAAAGQSVAGRVEVPGGLPAGERPRIVAHAYRPGATRSTRIETTVAPDGSFAIRLPEETRSVTLDLVGRLYHLPRVVEVPSGTSDVVLRPTLFAALQGRVHRPAGLEPEAGAEPIHVATRLSAGYTDRDGAFDLVVEPDLPLEVVASSEGRLAGLAEPTRLEGRQEVAALRPGEARWVELTLEPWGTVHGFVTDARGAPLEGATVELVLATEPTFKHLRIEPGRTGANGRFVIGPLRPGTSELLARAPGYRNERRTILLAEDGHIPLHFALVPSGVVSGRVFGPDGAAYAGAEVEVRGRRGTPFPGPASKPRARTDDQGRFTLSDEEDVLELVAFAPDLAPSVPLVLELGTGEGPSDVVLRLRSACSLFGLALDEERRPVGDALLLFRSEDGTTRVIATDAQGRFEEHGLPPGKARVEAGSFQIDQGRVRSAYSGALEVELTPEPGGRVELFLVRSKDD